MDFIQSKSMGCGSAGNLLLPVTGAGGGWTEGEAEEHGSVEHGGVVAEVFIIIWGWVVLSCLH